MLHSKYVRGALVFYDDYEMRWIDAIGEDVVKFIAEVGTPTDDTTLDPTRYTMTPIETGAGGTGISTVLNSLTAGELFVLRTANADYDGLNLQLKGEPFELTANLPLYFGIKTKISVASLSDFLVGICETDTDLLNESGSHALKLTGMDGIFFCCIDSTTTIAAKTWTNGVEINTADAAVAMDTAYHIYEIYWNGTQLEFYMDGAVVTTFTADWPTEDMTPSINFRTGAAANITMEVAWMRCIQIQ